MNNEPRYLQVAGIVCLEDITNAHTVDVRQIADSRISYRGRGTVNDIQQPRNAPQFFDTLMPF